MRVREEEMARGSKEADRERKREREGEMRERRRRLGTSIPVKTIDFK